MAEQLWWISLQEYLVRVVITLMGLAGRALTLVDSGDLSDATPYLGPRPYNVRAFGGAFGRHISGFVNPASGRFLSLAWTLYIWVV